jgi:hypothetical protein
MPQAWIGRRLSGNDVQLRPLQIAVPIYARASHGRERPNYVTQTQSPEPFSSLELADRHIVSVVIGARQRCVVHVERD